MVDLGPLQRVADWLLDRDACSPRTRAVLTALTFVAFTTLVIVGAAHHEIWRDEMRALTIAREVDSVLHMPRAVEDEGHPALWFVLLWLAYGVSGTTVVLKVVSATIGLGVATMVFFAAPLPTWWRGLFVFGWVPVYACSMLCRNYGIGVLLLFWFCACAGRGAFRPLRAALALALLANTNAYATMIAGALVPYFVVEAVRARVRARTLAAGVLLIAAGIALAAWTMMPTGASKVLAAPGDRFTDPLYTLLHAGWSFGTLTAMLFGVAHAAWPVVLLVIVATLHLPHLAIAVLGAFVGAAVFMDAIYPASTRHLSMLYAMLAAVTWLRAAAPATSAPARPLTALAWRVLLFGVWPLLLVVHGYRGLQEVKADVETTASAAPELARLLERDELRDAIVVGEPDYYVEALPYYRDNRIFVAREARFARRVSWTTANRNDLDLGELLATARTLHREHGVPVLLVIGHQIRLDRPDGTITHGYGDQFRWTAPQRAAFVAATEHLASLPARPSRNRGDERYEVYRLRP